MNPRARRRGVVVYKSKGIRKRGKKKPRDAEKYHVTGKETLRG